MDLKWRDAFIAAMRTYPVVRFACERAGVAPKTAYAHRNNDPGFAEDWDDARRAGLERLELIAFERSEQDDTMLRWILSRNWRERYGDAMKHEITGADGSPFRVVLSWGENGESEDAPNNGDPASGPTPRPADSSE